MYADSDRTPNAMAAIGGDSIMKWLYSSKIRASSLLSLGILVLISFFSSPAFAQFGGGGGGGGGKQPSFGPLPPATVQPLPSDAPAPWGTDPATLAGAKIADTIKGTGFLQETVTLQGGSSFFFQDINTSDFSVQSYVKNTAGITNDPIGNLIFNQTIKDPTWGLTDHTFMNGFKQPIQMKFDIVESKVAALTGGFNEMDIHFRQIPFLDTTTGKIEIKQDIGVWITSFAGLRPLDVTQTETFDPKGDVHTIATSIPSGGSSGGGGFGGGFGGGGGVSNGAIDFWSDMTAVKIVDAATRQLVTFSRCNDFGDPGRLQPRNDLGSRGGCNASGSTSSSRPPIPNHDADSFQLTPVDWDRWGGAGSGQINASGFSTVFPGAGSSGGGGR